MELLQSCTKPSIYNKLELSWKELLWNGPQGKFCVIQIEFQLVIPHCDLVMHIGGLVQDCIISSASAMEMLQSCTRPLIYA